jgi:hypothetical protein
LTSPALEIENPPGNEDSDIHGKPDAGKSHVVFGKKDTKAINLSDIVAG